MTDLTTDANLAVSTDMLSASGATASGATAATELPKTGPEQNLIVIAALLIAGALVYGYRARKA
jgi:LPXTG-motif cell wall-anchored protein